LRPSTSRAWRNATAAALTALVSIGLLAGCTSTASNAGSSSKPGAVRVVASTNVYGDIAKSIGGDNVDVTSIISNPGTDPHSYTANAQNELALSKAAIVVENGGGYDDFVDSMLKTAGNGAVKVINVVNLSGKVAPAGGDLNEHVWYDFPTVQKLISTLQSELSAVDPAAATVYAANATKFAAGLTGLESSESALRARYLGTGVAITEPVPLYLLQASGLVNKTPPAFSKAVEEEADVAPRVLSETLALFADKQVRLLVYNEQTSGASTDRALSAAKANNIPSVPVTETLPDGQHYLTWMAGIVHALESALTT
jgi:zinc/manganese transport system substrate-binding protein